MRGAALALLVLAAGCRDRETPAPEVGEPVRVSDGAAGTGQSEPSIAVSPDGATLLAGWVDWSGAVPVVRLARSTNGGTTFAASRRVHEPDAAHAHGQAEATLACDDGRFAVGWIGCRADADALENHACDVYAAISSDGGLSWTAPIAIAEGGAPRRDRPWMFVDAAGRFAIAWSEVGPQGTRWLLARERAGGGAFDLAATLDGRGATQPPASGTAGPEVLLIDRASRDPKNVLLEHRREPGAEPNARWAFPPEASLLPYSLGAFAAHPGGEAWLAIPGGDGERNDLSLLHRRASSTAFRALRHVRTPAAARVGLPWIAAGESSFVLAWAEESAGEGWRIRARRLGPGDAVSAAADVSRVAFRFHEASRTQNVGDFLFVTTAGDAFWVAWSDTRGGDADVFIARGRVR